MKFRGTWPKVFNFTVESFILQIIIDLLVAILPAGCEELYT